MTNESVCAILFTEFVVNVMPCSKRSPTLGHCPTTRRHDMTAPTPPAGSNPNPAATPTPNPTPRAADTNQENRGFPWFRIIAAVVFTAGVMFLAWKNVEATNEALAATATVDSLKRVIRKEQAVTEKADREAQDYRSRLSVASSDLNEAVAERDSLKRVIAVADSIKSATPQQAAATVVAKAPPKKLSR